MVWHRNTEIFNQFQRVNEVAGRWLRNEDDFVREQPFDSEGGGGGGGLALFGNKYSDLKMLEINNMSSSAKKINNLT